MRNNLRHNLLTAVCAAGLGLSCLPSCGPHLPSVASMAIPTPTPQLVCGLSDTYTFEDGSVACWAPNAASTSSVTLLASTTDRVHGGLRALQASVTNVTGGTLNLQLQLDFTSPRNFAGRAVTLWAYIDSTLTNSSTGLQVFSSNTGTGYEGVWTTVNPTTNTNQWIPLTFTFGSGGGSSNPSQTTRFGVQLTFMPAGAVGNIYLDDVVIGNLPPTPTPTPYLPTKLSWTFDNTPNTNVNNSVGTALGQSGTWYDNPGAPATGVFSWLASGVSASAGCVASWVTFTAQNQNEKITYTPPSLPWNWSPAGLDLKGIRASVWIDSSLSNGYPGVQVSVASGPSSTWEQSSWIGLSKDAWTLVAFEPTFAGGSSADVRQLWFQFGTGGTGTVFAPGYVKLDSVEIY